MNLLLHGIYYVLKVTAFYSRLFPFFVGNWLFILKERSGSSSKVQVSAKCLVFSKEIGRKTDCRY